MTIERLIFLSVMCPLLLCCGSGRAQEEMPITDSDRSHWSFAQLQLPTVPQVTSSLTRHAIDSFIAQALQRRELDLAPAAQPLHLLRRMSYDLTGLPPTQEAIDRFMSRQELPDAYEREVDRLLASPACGEHLAQGWLDLARYAESDGFEHDKVRPAAWQYRSWVIDAINADLPYDQFMQLQVAGDLISDDAQARVATMFCLSGSDMPDLNDQEERRHNLLNEMTGTVGSVMLGLQLGCAACHDHKSDPLSQADFYRLRGILATGVGPLKRDKPWNTLVQQSSSSPVWFYHRGDHRQATHELNYGLPRVVTDASTSQRIATSTTPRLILAQWLAAASNPLPARVEANRIWQSLFGLGLAATPADLGLVGIEPNLPELLDYLAWQMREHDWSRQWLRRQVLLSAAYRAASLCVDDWGGDDSGGDDSGGDDSGGDDSGAQQQWQLRLARDPDNRLFSRSRRRRLTGEMLRDTMLQVAGLLDQQQGGSSVMPPLPEELTATLLKGQWSASQKPADHVRRSIYIFARRNLRYPVFESFDRPDAGASCARRDSSVTATQALLMLNSQFTWQVAAALAHRVADSQQPVDQLYRIVLGRPSTATERQLLEHLMAEFADSNGPAPALAGRQAAALVLLNCNEFITLD